MLSEDKRGQNRKIACSRQWCQDTGKHRSKVGYERIVDKDNKKQTTDGDDQNDQGPRAECPKRNPVNVHGPLMNMLISDWLAENGY